MSVQALQQQFAAMEKVLEAKVEAGSLSNKEYRNGQEILRKFANKLSAMHGN